MIPVQQGPASFALEPLLDTGPFRQQALQIFPQLRFFGPLGHGAHNQAHPLGLQGFRQFLQPGAFLFRSDLAGDAHAALKGEEHQEPSRRVISVVTLGPLAPSASFTT